MLCDDAFDSVTPSDAVRLPPVSPSITAALPMEMIAGGFTVSRTALVVALPSLFAKRARKRLPLSVSADVAVKVFDVALATFEYDEPPFVDTCHCTVGVGVPV